MDFVPGSSSAASSWDLVGEGGCQAEFGAALWAVPGSG